MVVGDHIGYRFEILSRLGKGSFGQVGALPCLLPASCNLALLPFCSKHNHPGISGYNSFGLCSLTFCVLDWQY